VIRPILIVSVLIGASCCSAVAAPEPDVVAGREAYVANCARCHGDTGKGDGPDSKRMVPRPRDFTTGVFKFRTTASGTPPTDEDLYRTISYGLAGTRMPGWEGLSEETRRQLIAYIKSLSTKFSQATPQPLDLGKDPGAHGADLAKGKKLYADLGCAACHGTLGRANGASAKALTDDWGQPIRPANLAHGWALRGGREPRDLVARLMTGVDGTPMPSYADSVAHEDLWQLAYYLRSIQESARWETEVTVAPAAALPTSPTDPAWDRAPRTDTKLWSNLYAKGAVVPAQIPWAVVQAVATPDAIAVRIGWDDPTEDRGTPADRVALVLKPDGVQWEVGSLQSWPLPGAAALDVTLWSATASEAHYAVATGFELPEGAGALPAQAQYVDGRWWLMLTRPRTTLTNITLTPTSSVPLALVIWDGSHGDTGRQRSVSPWLSLTLAAPTSTKENTHATH